MSCTMSEDIAGNGEGITDDSPLRLSRTEKCQQVSKLLGDKTVVLLRAPPYSGKSSLATLMRQCAPSYGYMAVYSISLLSFNNNSEMTLSEYFNKQTGASLDDLFLCQPPSRMDHKELVIIDETQKLYKKGNDMFWQQLKEHMNQDTRRNNACHFLLLSAYGESPMINSSGLFTGTPIQFTSFLDMSFMWLTNEEFTEMIQKYNSTSRGRQVLITDAIARYIFSQTNGHVGLVRETISSLDSHFFSHSSTKPNTSDLQRYLLSGPFMQSILETRAVSRREQSGFKLTDMEVDIITNVINSPNGHVDASLIHERKTAESQLVVSGILSRCADGLCFPAPVLQSIQINQLFATMTSVSISNMDCFIEETIARFKPSVLRDTGSTGSDGAIYERQFQCEFYRCAMAALGGSHGYCFPDVGRVFGSSGFLDFYVNSHLQWGVELVRNSDKLDEHAARFGPGGIYQNFPFKDYVILNFVEQESKRKHKPRFTKEVVVLHNASSTEVVLRRRIGRSTVDKTIKLLGDDLT
jgi:6-pyruvoyl-tetrahydropterin synthase